MRATQLALEALGGARVGTPWRIATRCACCGAPIAEGDLAVPTSFGNNFTDDLSLATRSGVVCGACAPFLTIGPMRALQKVVVTRDGAYPLAKDVHRAWFFLTPPEPPYVAVVSDSMLQHLVWRTPVTLSNDLQIVRLGQRLLTIRRPVLLAALDWAREAMLATLEPGQPAPENFARHPYVSLDREMTGTAHARIRNDVAAAPRAAPWLAKLRELTPGETWALATLAKRAGVTPEQPERLPSPFRATAA